MEIEDRLETLRRFILGGNFECGPKRLFPNMRVLPCFGCDGNHHLSTACRMEQDEVATALIPKDILTGQKSIA